MKNAIVRARYLLSAKYYLWMLTVILLGCSAIKAQDGVEIYEHPSADSKNLKIFDEILEIAGKNYFDPTFGEADWKALGNKYRVEVAAASNNEIFNAAINRMLSELNVSHLQLLSPRLIQRLIQPPPVDRKVAGFSQLKVGNKRVVFDVMPYGAAAKAGVKIGWVVNKRNGLSMADSELGDENEGITNTWEFSDETGQRRTLTLTNNLTETSGVFITPLRDGYLFIRVDGFSPEVGTWLSEQLKSHRGAPGVILDFRHNKGGIALSAHSLISDFFPSDVDVGQYVTRDGVGQPQRSDNQNSAHYSGRVVILTGGGTASGAEIFTHVLQHYHRATVVGRKTIGRVLVAVLFKLSDDSILEIPLQDYLGLDGQRLEGRGVDPDIIVPQRTIISRVGDDLDVEAALKVLRK